MNIDLPKTPGAHWRPFYVLRSLGFTDKEVMHMAGERIGMLRRWRDPKVRYRYLTPQHARRLRKVAAAIMSNVWGRLALLLTYAELLDKATRARVNNAVIELNDACMALLGDDVPIWKVDEWLEALAQAEAAEEAPPDELCD